MQKITWGEAKEYLRNFNRENGYGCGKGSCDKIVNVVVVFTENSFTKPYDLEASSYRVCNDNKAFLDGMCGYSIYGSSLDGSDVCVRLEGYMELEHGGKNGWKVDYCYKEA